jgi:diguanylate cyclase (GGDEF)-like protein/putative nucleotidyltransferase with HDIG domain
MTLRKLHRPAQIYVGALIGAGGFAIAAAAHGLASDPPTPAWLILAALTLLSGSANVRLPSVAATISVSETFVFASVLLFGTDAGTLTVALDAFVVSVWLALKRRRELYRVLFNIAAPAVSIWIAAHFFFLVARVPRLTEAPGIGIQEIALPLIGFTLVYFLLNSWFITFAIALKERIPAFPVWRDNFLWLSLNYFGGASVAALLVGYRSTLDIRLLLVLAPILLVLYYTFRTAMGRVQDTNDHLARMNQLYLSTIETLAAAIDAKDQVTHGHIRRVQQQAVALAEELGVQGNDQVKAIEAASLLHDMGKLAVPEYILNKPGPLTAAEFERMKTHAGVGADILSAIEFPYPVVPIVRHHHENWDGSGYPSGLKGTEIPIGARILSVVDCFDALTSDRPYRPRLSDADALRILNERRGRMYDPLVVDAFLRLHARSETADEPVGIAQSGLAAIAELASKRFADARERQTQAVSDVVSIYELARALAKQHLPAKDIASLIGTHLRNLVAAKLYVFFVCDHTRGELKVAHAFGDGTPALEDLVIPLGQRLSGWVAVNRGTIINSDPVLDLGEVARTGNPSLTSALSVALVAEGNLIGVLSLYSDQRFAQDDARILEVAGRYVATAMGGAGEAEQRLSDLTDAVTGLPDIELGEGLLEAEIAASLRGEQALSLLLIDVNKLKGLNNRQGRASGDAFLARLTKRLRESLRTSDVLFRFRSDEFVIALPQTDSGGASRITDRVLLNVSSDPGLLSAGILVGAASAPIDGSSLEELLECARMRLQDPSASSRADL